MDKFYSRYGIDLMIFLPFAMAIHLYCDWRDPELWGDWQHDPFVYLPLILLMLLSVLPYVVYILCGVRHLHNQIRQRTARVDSLRKLGQK